MRNAGATERLFELLALRQHKPSSPCLSKKTDTNVANSGASNKNSSVQGIDQQAGSRQSQGAEQEGGGCCQGGKSQPSSDQSQKSKQSQKAENEIGQQADSSATSAPGVQSNVNAPVRAMDNRDLALRNAADAHTAIDEVRQVSGRAERNVNRHDDV